MGASFREDATLVERFQSGDTEAFNEIDRRYRVRLVHFLFQRSHSQEIAEELAQETLARALASLSGLKDGRYLAQWLYRVAHNNLIDYFHKNSPPHVRIVSYDDSLSDEPGGEERASGALFTGFERRPDGIPFDNRSPEEQVVCSDGRNNIWRIAKETLSVEEFQALWMKYVDDFSDEQIASELNRRVVSTRVFLSRIRKKLSKYLQDGERDR